jgi:hypothetical protein
MQNSLFSPRGSAGSPTVPLEIDKKIDTSAALMPMENSLFKSDKYMIVLKANFRHLRSRYLKPTT